MEILSRVAPSQLHLVRGILSLVGSVACAIQHFDLMSWIDLVHVPAKHWAQTSLSFFLMGRSIPQKTRLVYWIKKYEENWRNQLCIFSKNDALISRMLRFRKNEASKGLWALHSIVSRSDLGSSSHCIRLFSLATCFKPCFKRWTNMKKDENDIKDESDANDEDVTNIVVNIHVIFIIFRYI